MPGTPDSCCAHGGRQVYSVHAAKRFAKLGIIDVEVTRPAIARADEAKLIPQAVAVPAWFPKLASQSHSRECRSNQRQL